MFFFAKNERLWDDKAAAQHTTSGGECDDVTTEVIIMGKSFFASSVCTYYLHGRMGATTFFPIYSASVML
jgi:hypothetical protein